MKKVLVIGCLWQTLCWGEPLVVVANGNFAKDSLHLDEIRSLYEAKEFRLGGERITPLNLGIDHPLRKRFEQTVLKEDRDLLAQEWLQAHYQGHRPPKVVKSPETAAEFISKVDNTLGYMEEPMAQQYHLKILYREHE